MKTNSVFYKEGYKNGVSCIPPEVMIKKLGWKKCKEISEIFSTQSSKVIWFDEKGLQYEFFILDLKYLLSFYYK